MKLDLRKLYAFKKLEIDVVEAEVIKEVFDNSVHIFSENEIIKEGHKIHSNFIGYHHYVGKIEDNGNEYYVRFTVQELNTRKKDFVPNQLHSTFVSDIEIMSANTRVNTGKSPATTNINTPVDAKLQIFLETAIESKENCSKVVDENGEPRVVYHQTNSTIFINRETGESFYNLNWKEKDYWKNEVRKKSGRRMCRQLPLTSFSQCFLTKGKRLTGGCLISTPARLQTVHRRNASPHCKHRNSHYFRMRTLRTRVFPAASAFTT